jgi:hypothetical protein
MRAFPDLEKPAADEKSTGSTATTTSLTVATDDAIRKLETQWKTDKNDCTNGCKNRNRYHFS